MSFPYKRILCAVDFDDHAAVAIKEAAALARAGHGVVILFHVVWVTPLATEGYVLAELQKSQMEDASLKLEDLGRQALGGAQYELAIELGDPGDGILAATRRCNADLLVMATHGRRGVSHLVLGSVAERVVRLSPIPTLTIRPTT
jgi:nucleotide-binding universal stress UspA family protein